MYRYNFNNSPHLAKMDIYRTKPGEIPSFPVDVSTKQPIDSHTVLSENTGTLSMD